MSPYSYTRSRVFQWMGIIVVALLIGTAYWYFSVRASALNAPQNSSMTSGLVGLWSFNGDDISGTTAYDRSGSGNNGTLTNGPVITEGKSGQALSFDGSDDYVSMPHSSAYNFSYSQDFNVSLWVKIPSTQVNTGFTTNEIIQKWDGGANGYPFSIRLRNQTHASPGTIQAQRWDQTNAPIITSTKTINDNTWHHISFTKSSSTLQLYIDGVSQGTATDTTTGTTTNTNLLSLGVRAGTLVYYLSGSIDEVRIYNRALAASEIQSLYALGQSDKVNSSVSQPQGTGRLDSGLAGYWKLDDATGSSATDSSTNGVTGTLTNMEEGDWTTGQINGALDFDGSNEYIDINATTTLFNSAYGNTVSFWAYLDGYAVDTYPTAINLRTDQATGFIIFMSNQPGYAGISFGSSSNFVTRRTATDISSTITGQWKHVALVYDGISRTATSSYVLYVDGVALGLTNSSSFGSISNVNMIGYDNDGGSPNNWDGKLDEIRIYSRALSADEVAELYRLTTPTGVDTGLKGYWSFNAPDMTSTSAFDRSGAGNTGTLTNSPSIVEGKMGQGLDMNGSNQYISIADSTSLDIGDTDDLTLTGWFYRDTFTTDDTIIAKRNGVADTDDVYILFVDDNTDKLTFEVSENSGTDEYLVESKVVFTSAGWHHFAVVWDQDSATNSEIYINGTAGVATDTGTIGNLGDLGNSVVLALGAESDAGNPFDGRLDEMRLYKRALTASEIKALYDASEADKVNSSASQPGGTGQLQAGLVGYWPLDEGTGTTAADASGGGNNGTVPNSWTTGQVGNAVSFNGSTSMTVAAGTGVLDAKQDVTMAAWVYPRTTGAYRGWFYKGVVGCDEGSAKYMFENDASGYLRLWVGGSSLTHTTALTTNQWQHIAATNSTGGSAIYINGNLAVSGSALPAPTSSSQDWTFNKCNSIDANMDEIRIYNRALSADELRQLYQLRTPTGVDTSLRGYWSFNGQDMSGTTAFDRSGLTNHGTLTNGPTITEGKLGQGLSFDGSDDYVDMGGASGVEPTFPFSVSAWVKLNSLTNAIPITSSDTGGNGVYSGFTMFVNTDSSLSAGIGDNSANCDAGPRKTFTTSSTGLVTTGNWYHITMVFTSISNFAIYLNGTSQAGSFTGSATSIVYATNSRFQVGTYYDACTTTTKYMNGIVDEARLYNTALTASQIAALYNAGR